MEKTHYVISTYLRQHEIYLVMRGPLRTIAEAVVNDFNRNVTVSSASVDVAAEKKKGYNLGMEYEFHQIFISRLCLFYKSIKFPLLNISKHFIFF